MQIEAIRKLYYNLSLNKKIFIIITMMFLIFACAVAFIIDEYYVHTLIRERIEQNEGNLNLVRETIESSFDNLIYLLELYLLDEYVQKYSVFDDSTSSSERRQYEGLLQQEFNILTGNNPLVNGVLAFFFDGNISSSSLVWDNLYRDENEHNIETEDFTYGYQPTILSTRTVSYYGGLDREEGINVLSIRALIVSYETVKVSGFLQFDIFEEVFFDAFFRTVNSANNRVYIVNSSNEILSCQNKDLLYKQLDTGKLLGTYPDTMSTLNQIDGEEYVVSEMSIGSTEWKMVNVLSRASITADVFRLQVLIFAALLIIVIMLLSLVYLIIRKITLPLASLVRSMDNLGKNVEPFEMPLQGDNEIVKLSTAFNKMSKRLTVLMQRIKTEQRIKRKYAMRAVMEQIKPHFLYNTLDNISALISLDMNDEAYKTTKALALFYKKSLSKGSETIKIGDEIEMIKNYLYIQSIRFKDKFDYIINVDETIFDYTMPKMLLQPLVENAIIHGINSKQEKGYMEVSYEKKGEYITFSIFDTGLGFTEDILLSVEGTANFGLNYIFQRLGEYKDEKCRFSAKNIAGKGAVVSVTIKVVERELLDDE